MDMITSDITVQNAEVTIEENKIDSISRQAAIDVVEGGAELIRRVLDNMDVVIGNRSKFAFGLGLLDACIEELSGLPPAQSEIIRCKDCKHRPKIAEGHDVNDYTNNGFALDFPNDFACPCRCEDPYYSWMPADNWFCANGAKKED